jgi:FkbM family methyltransferase
MCFRLLLGREPNAEEWAGHSAQAGHELSGVVAGYVNSLEFARRGLLRMDVDDRPQIATWPGFRIYASPSDLQVGRHVLGGAYEAEVAAVFQQLLLPAMTVVDIGANIGFFTMLSAALTGPDGAVLAVEPNPANGRLIEASRRLNGFSQVTVAQVAAGRSVGVLALNTTHSNGTTSEPADDADQLLQARTVPCMPVDVLVEATWGRARRVDLIKVDVEGAEYNALLGAQGTLLRDRPVIISEFSPTFMPGISGIDGPGYLAWLFGLGYAVAVIEPAGSPVAMGQDGAAVMAAFEARQVDHIDIMATPISG